MTITKKERSARKKQCGTENPARASSWIQVINALEEQTWASSPAQVMGLTRTDLARVLGGKDLSLCAQDFIRCFPHRKGFDGMKQEDLAAIRNLLCDAFDLPVTG